jgi:hypothetical protein
VARKSDQREKKTCDEPALQKAVTPTLGLGCSHLPPQSSLYIMQKGPSTWSSRLNSHPSFGKRCWMPTTRRLSHSPSEARDTLISTQVVGRGGLRGRVIVRLSQLLLRTNTITLSESSRMDESILLSFASVDDLESIHSRGCIHELYLLHLGELINKKPSLLFDRRLRNNIQSQRFSKRGWEVCDSVLSGTEYLSWEGPSTEYRWQRRNNHSSILPENI